MSEDVDQLAAIGVRLSRELSMPGLTSRQRLLRLWCVAKAARDCGPAIGPILINAARGVGLYRRDVEHVVRWGLFGRDPWEAGL